MSTTGSGPEHEHTPQPLGHILDQLGVKGCIHEGDFITDAVVVVKVSAADGTTGVGLYSSEDLQPYDRYAMLGIATRIIGGTLQ
ncbi:hypothetical protein [Nonomuraea sp. NPDC003214]